MTAQSDSNAMANVSPPRKKQRSESATTERDELLSELDERRGRRIYGEAFNDVEKEIVPVPKDLPQIPWCKIPQRDEANQLKSVTTKDNQQAVRLYWFDASCERSNIIYMFGKAETTSGQLVSCCTVIDDMMRNIYLLPKQFVETPFVRDLARPSEDDVALAEELMGALADLCDAQNIQNPRMKFVRRKYAFEEPGVPYEENTYLKLSYPYRGTNELRLPANHSTFSKIFGASQSALELLLLKKRIKGPCWLDIHDLSAAEDARDMKSMDMMGSQHGTWCRMELKTGCDRIFASNDQSRVPHFTAMSMKVKTVLNENKKVNEIVAISAVVHRKVVIDGPTPDVDAGFEKFVLVRNLDSSDDALPISEGESVLPNEFSLLNLFMNKLHRIDPDIIIGHNFLSYDLDVLLHRMKVLNVSTWSKLGRLRLRNFPKLQSGPGGMSESTREEKRVMTGRLVVDTYLSAKEYLKESSYALLALAVSRLGAEEIKEDIVLENDVFIVRNYITKQEGLTSFVAHLEYNSLIALRLMFKLSLLPMTKELTNIAGNLWSKTLTGSRSDRVEHLLLHEFYNRKYIVPNKTFNTVFSNAKRKAAYSGGLVLEPQKGLYDKYVLLLDFNSLYPSIILENNICFTTIERPRKEITEEANVTKKPAVKNNTKQQPKKDENNENEHGDVEEPESGEAPAFEAQPPEPGLKQAILPSIIGSLLDKRRSAKYEMGKAAKDGDKVREWQYNVKQNALKLTANSTYGCLGFQYSRFYCQAMAELITRLGRGILRTTKDRIEQSKDMGYTVVYGDTDSVMVLTPYVKYDEAYKVGELIQASINKGNRYLEIGIDGLFRRILLLRKKKYVAIVHSKKDGQIVSTIENKGIDMVRRDWCELSRDVSQFCVDQILKTSNAEEGDNDDITAEDVVNAIHQHLREVKEEVLQDQLPLSKYIITRGLTKAPEDYPDASHHPHVQVAFDMKRRNIPVRVGQRIPYVICSKSTNPNPKTIAERAVHPQVFEEMNKRSPGTFVIDAEWYLSQQVFPPVFRLCEHMEGTDAKMLADCLGLDKQKYSSSSNASYDEVNGHLDYIMMSDMNMDDDDKYKRVKIKPIRCSRCGHDCHLNIVQRLIDLTPQAKSDLKDFALFECNSCGNKFSTPQLTNWAQKNVREQIQRYYSGWMTVPHHIVKAGLGQNRTRVASMTPKHGIVGGMIVSVREEFSAQDLQLHLQYLMHMFDITRAFTKAEKQIKQKPDSSELAPLLRVLQALPDIQEAEKNLAIVRNKVHKFLQKSGRQWVQLDDLFAAICKVAYN